MKEMSVEETRIALLSRHLLPQMVKLRLRECLGSLFKELSEIAKPIGRMKEPVADLLSPADSADEARYLLLEMVHEVCGEIVEELKDRLTMRCVVRDGQKSSPE